MPPTDRLRWQCRRGMLELDILLEEFLDHAYADLDEDGRAAFEDLLTYPDQLLYEYLMGQQVPTDQGIASVIRRIRRAPAA